MKNSLLLLLIFLLFGCSVEEEIPLVYSQAITYPNGSANKAVGKIAIISIFISEEETSWDFSKQEDIDARENTLTYLKIACDYLALEASKYNQKLELVYDWQENTDLYYEVEYEDNMIDQRNYMLDQYLWEYIDDNIKLSPFEYDGFVYMFFYNTDLDYDHTSNTRSYYENMPYPYEFCSIYVHSFNIEENPAAYAHEILHTFGAPDLYMAGNYNINEEFVEYVSINMANDLMYTVYDLESGLPLYDQINNEISDLDAYYIGWLDECELVEEWNLSASDFQD